MFKKFVLRIPFLFTVGVLIIFSVVSSVTEVSGQIILPSPQTSLPSQSLPSSPPPSNTTVTATGNATTATSFVAHGVRITSPAAGLHVPIGILTVTGISKDNATTDCQVSVIVNSVKPYQNASATGSGGVSDYSKWNFMLTSKYTLIKEGVNKITAKFSCKPNSSLASFYSVNVTGAASSVSAAAPRTITATTTNVTR